MLLCMDGAVLLAGVQKRVWLVQAVWELGHVAISVSGCVPAGIKSCCELYAFATCR